MRLTTKGRNAVTAILDVALYERNGPVSVSDVATRQGLSPSYLEKLFSYILILKLEKEIIFTKKTNIF